VAIYLRCSSASISCDHDCEEGAALGGLYGMSAEVLNRYQHQALRATHCHWSSGPLTMLAISGHEVEAIGDPILLRPVSQGVGGMVFVWIFLDKFFDRRSFLRLEMTCHGNATAWTCRFGPSVQPGFPRWVLPRIRMFSIINRLKDKGMWGRE
jgi:hypothetical protein